MRRRSTIAILAILGALVLPVVTQVPCPYCGGSGEVVPPIKFPRLNITSMYLEQAFGCDVDSFLNINITATNTDPLENETGLASLVVQTVAGEFAIPVRYDVAANSTELLPLQAEIPINYKSPIRANLTSPSGEEQVIRCPYCGGAGILTALRYVGVIVRMKWGL